MVQRLKVRPIGGSLGAIFPKELLERLRVGKDDELFAIDTEQGVLLTPFDPEFEKSMAAFEVGRRKYRNALRKLAE